MLGYMFGVTLIITLLPFRFARPDAWRVIFSTTTVDVVANVVMFIPLGFLYRVGTSHHRRHSTLRVLWMGAVVSSGIELAQLFEVERFTSLLDVGANALGAWLGALCSDRAAARLRNGTVLVGRLSLELPLMGLVYLIVPLLWLNALAAGGDALHARLSLLLAVFGACVLGGLQRFHWGPDRGLRVPSVAAGAVLWYAAGSFPLLPREAWVVGGGCLVAGIVAWRGGMPRIGEPVQDRRYEVPVLMSAVPVYAIYVAALSAQPLWTDGVGPWSLGVGFPGVAAEFTTLEILRLLEMCAAFTLLGYLVAEYGGRRISRFAGALPRLWSWSLAGCLCVEVVRGFHAMHGASVARAAVLCAACLYGGWLYYLQRDHVLRLLAIPGAPTTSRGGPGQRHR